MWGDATASHTLPPGGVIGAEAATYGLLGGRIEGRFGRLLTLLSGQLGTAMAGEGRWLRGDAAVMAGTRLGPVGAQAVVSGFGLRYLDPFEYTAAAVDLRPRFSTSVGPFLAIARPVLTTGVWHTDQLEGSLRTVGGEMDLERQLGGWSAALSGGALQVTNGVFDGAVLRGGGRVEYGRGGWRARGVIQAQRTPLETELGATLTLSAGLVPGVQLQVTAGRTVRDLVFGTPGTTTVSAGLSLRALDWAPAAPAPVATVAEPRKGGRLVRFTLRAPGAEEVAVTGDFTEWEPVAMTRAGGGWTVELVLPAGLHHFGFLVDGQWAVPEDAPGLVDDGWGRRNASIVIEP